MRAIIWRKSQPSWECKRSSLSCAWPSCFDGSSDTAARPENALHDRPLRLGCAHHVFQHLVDDILLKDPEIPVFKQVLLDGFKLQAKPVGHITDLEHTEVRQAGLGAD